MLIAAALLAATLQSQQVTDSTRDLPASPGTLAPDRPGFTTGPSVMPRGFSELEAGTSLQRQPGFQHLAIGESLLRIGLSSRAELRVGFSSLDFDRAGGTVTHGFEDASIGTKVRLRSAPAGVSLLPAVSMIASSNIPTGGAFGRSGVEPQLTASLGWQLPAKLALVTNTGVASRVAGDGARTREFGGGASLSRALTGTLNTYVEYSGTRRNGPDSQYLNTGLTFVPAAHLQLDTWVARAISGTPSSFQLGVGVSRRW
ncbi:MAG: transporter [Gemmatimonadaceae bacterium]|nr:transporter [Gemmatimonadaceae bacterium]